MCNVCNTCKILCSALRGALVLSALVLGLSAPSAQARSSDIVIDANTGRVLRESQADATRFPASLTKVMTLYLLFEQIEKGNVKLNGEIAISPRAASAPPSKLGLKPGLTIEVEDAILALVTRSANDIAVAIAEHLGGSEAAFARMMTVKAKQIGMDNTRFVNASGLPDSEQTTTARDLALLGRAMYERFPTYSKYFARSAFVYNGRAIRNHNKLLGRVDGVDGIKTGYTRASGFNLITSLHQGGRHVIAVVMGGNTGPKRDAKMRDLLASYLPKASPKKIVDQQLMARLKMKDDSKLAVVRTDDSPPVKKASVTFAQAAPAAEDDDSEDGVETSAKVPLQLAAVQKSAATASPVPAASAGLTWVKGPQPWNASETTASLPAVPASILPNGEPAKRMVAQSAEPVVAAVSTSTAGLANSPATKAGNWVVQIAATSNENEALKMLGDAQAKARVKLASVEPFTERVVKGSTTLYRARFRGFSEREDADAACKALKRSDVSCIAIRL